MAEILYPKLHDSEWLEAHPDLLVSRIAEEIGCSKAAALKALKQFNLIQTKPHWSDIEKQVLRDLFSDWGGKFVSMGINRDKYSAWRIAKKLGLQSNSKGRRLSETAFWSAWRKYLKEQLRHWIDAGCWDQIKHFVIRPAIIPREGCNTCPYHVRCKRVKLLFCETLSVEIFVFLQLRKKKVA